MPCSHYARRGATFRTKDAEQLKERLIISDGAEGRAKVGVIIFTVGGTNNSDSGESRKNVPQLVSASRLW